MSVIPSLGRVEAALQRWLELPFLRRAPVDLPLLKTQLKRAMVDELKPVAPSRFVLAVPAQQSPEIEPHREEWERQLAEYFLDLVQENGWSTVTPPRVEIVEDPGLQDNTVMVSVDEDYLSLRGRTVRQNRRRGGLLGLLTSTGVMAACVYLAILLVLPSDLLRWLPVPRVPNTHPSLGAPVGPSIQLPVFSVWNDGAKAVGDGIQSLGKNVGEAVPHQLSGEVTTQQGLTVRAGSPSRAGATLDGPQGVISQGSSLQWWNFQETRGESIGGEDRWLRIGLAGPEWGDKTGEVLYVWMGGISEK